MITFGPVSSRRLGRSLGINNITRPKVCSYNCIYCQVGLTDRITLTRGEFFMPEQILSAAERHLEKNGEGERPDYLTFVSNGEPTLDINLGRSIALLKKLAIPIAVITNSSLLHDAAVREELMSADLISVKADAADRLTWLRVNRPVRGLSFEMVTEGLKLFAAGYNGRLITETMLCRGVNESEEQIVEVASLVRSLNPARAYIAIPTRPPASRSVLPPEIDRINLAWNIFSEAGLDTVLLTGFEGIETGATGNIREDILNITAVHPLREDAMQSLLARSNADFSVVESLLRQKLIRASLYRGERFYLRDFHLS